MPSFCAPQFTQHKHQSINDIPTRVLLPQVLDSHRRPIPQSCTFERAAPTSADPKEKWLSRSFRVCSGRGSEVDRSKIRFLVRKLPAGSGLGTRGRSRIRLLSRARVGSPASAEAGLGSSQPPFPGARSGALGTSKTSVLLKETLTFPPCAPRRDQTPPEIAPGVLKVHFWHLSPLPL